ncbi:MAG: TolC family protein, partial [Sphaerochaetaceae bacterium]|nr:TolC family protein [Sphaerochaetaceae bacterium]
KANVWDGGNAVRNVARTESQKSSAYIDTSQGKQEVRNTLRENYSNIQLASSMISYYDSKVDADQQKVDRQNELLSAGAASEADLIKAQMQVKADEIERLQELIALASAYYTVSYLGS